MRQSVDSYVPLVDVVDEILDKLAAVTERFRCWLGAVAETVDHTNGRRRATTCTLAGTEQGQDGPDLRYLEGADSPDPWYRENVSAVHGKSRS